jgi:DNA-binding NtrC family response regulator
MARARVLVIDDEPQFLEMLTEVLTLAGHEVATGCGAGGSARLTGNADEEVGRTTLRWGAAAGSSKRQGAR